MLNSDQHSPLQQGMNNQCQGFECTLPSKFTCPTCITLSIGELCGGFCSQECFKKNWKSHKLLHGNPLNSSNPWPDFKFSGKLRPFYPLSPYRKVPDHIAKPDYAISGTPTSEVVRKQSHTIEVISDPKELEKLRKVCKDAKAVLDNAASHVRPGITTDELDKIVHEHTISLNAYPSPLNYYSFPKSVCTSVNEVICHGIPDGRPLVDGDLVNLDVTIYRDGYHGDLNATYPVGNLDEAGHLLINTARDALFAAIEEGCKPGKLYRDLGDIIGKVVEPRGFSVVRTYCGHGIGKLFHTAPNVPHYPGNKAVGVMKPGHVFTIEPMICEGTWKDIHWPDNWTAVTADGKRSAQFEHTLLITDSGVEILTK